MVIDVFIIVLGIPAYLIYNWYKNKSGPSQEECSRRLKESIEGHKEHERFKTILKNRR